jgi:acetyl esterase/lipase
MKKLIKIENHEPLIMLSDTIVYDQKPYWCNGSTRQLCLSFMAPRRYYEYDVQGDRPLIIFLCGGGFTKMDRNAWMGELAWFVKKGYAVASVEYSTLPYTVWPDQITEIKRAIRFLRVHATAFNIQPDKFAVMGESAGAYLANLAALSSGDKKYDTGDFLDHGSDVQAAVSFYCVSKLDGVEINGSPNLKGFPDLPSLVTPAAPPFLLFHGTDDKMVDCMHSEVLYDALISSGVRSELYLVEGANHADIHFMQKETKEIILSFLDSALKQPEKS